MDPPSPQNNAESNEAVLALVDEFLERRQAGEDLTPERFAAEHPELAEELRVYLPGLPLIDKACMLGADAVADEHASTPAEFPVIEGFELIEPIGRGGMGVVYKALQLSTKRIVALKVMQAGPSASESARQRFKREVELAARLQHPSIVRVLEGGEARGQRYYAMDHVAGVRLDHYLAASHPDLRTTLNLFGQVCAAVEYAHRHGVIHRDLKPANVLIDDDGSPHILDFGLAKATDQGDTEETGTAYASLPGQVVGTLFYLSPEQAAGAPDEIDARTDVYALGVMLFEALTGSLPFDATGPPARVIQRILETPATPPSSLSKQVDAELETIILKALEKDKAHRYQSPREMAEDIRRYVEGDPILARQPRRLYVLRKKLRKHWLAAALGAAAAAALAMVIVGLWTESRSRQRDLADARRDLDNTRRAALGAQRSLDSQNPRDALVMAHTLFERRPEVAEVALVWVQALYRTGQQYAGVAVLEDVLKDDPSRWACRALLAELYRAAGDVERADTEQERAERDAPDTGEAWYLRSFATLRPEIARRCAQEAVKREPSHVLAWERLTWLRLHTGDPDGALQGADRLIELGESAHHWTLFKGTVLARQGNVPKAIEEYARLGPSAYVYLAHAYRRIKEYEKAVEYYTKLVEPQGETAANVWHIYQRATPLWILGRTDEALEDYRRVRLLLGRPDFSDARRYIILRELGRQSEARAVLDAALRDVERPSWLHHIFRCLDGQTTPEELIEAAAARNNPETLCEAYYYAGEVCLLAGDRAAARKWFEQCVQTGVAFDPDASLETPMNEYELAQWRLDSIFAEESPTSRP